MAMVLFVFFGGALFFARRHRKKMKKSDCGDEGEHSCSSCSCEQR